MKKHLALLAATAVLGVTSAFAANPFSDVTPQDWAYQAVAQLASQGVVNGYPDGTFQGQNNITRYEMAQMVAKAMVRQGQVDAEQNAIINRLANEFSSELNSLGVKVNTLENKVGSFKFSGDARIRFDRTTNDLDEYAPLKVDDTNTAAALKAKYDDADAKLKALMEKQEAYDKADAAGKAAAETALKTANDDYEAATTALFPPNTDLDSMVNHSAFKYRARVNFDATVNDNTKASVRLVALDKKFDGSNDIKAAVDNAYVEHNFGKYVTATAGRYDSAFGAGLTYDDALEGLTVKAGTDALNGSVTFAHPTAMGFNAVMGAYDETKTVSGANTVIHHNAKHYTHDFLGQDGKTNPELTVFQLNGMIGPKVNVGAFYTKVNGHKFTTNEQHLLSHIYGGVVARDTNLDFYGAYANANLGHKWSTDVEFARFKDIKNSNAWAAGVAYGDYNIAKEGTWNAKVQYFNFDALAPIFSTTHATPFTQNYKTWMVTGNYAVANNVGLKALATVDAKDKEGKRVPNFVRAELNYKF